MSDGLFVLEEGTGAILEANRRAEEICGRAREALRGLRLFSLGEGEPPQALRDAIAGGAAAEETRRLEWRMRRASGRPLQVEVGVGRARFWGADRVVAVVRETGEGTRGEGRPREREPRGVGEAEAALDEVKRLEGERDLAMDVLERADAFAVLDSEFRFELVNEALERLFRRRREEMIGRRVWEVFAVDPGARCRAACERVMRDRLPESFEERCRHLDAWTSVSVHPTRQGGIAVFVRDVSEHRRAEEAFREQEALASRVLASSLNGIYVVDLDLQAPVFVNARYTQLTGYGLDDLRSIGRDLVEELFHPDDRARMREHIAAMRRARDGEVRDVEYRFRAKDGRWLSCFSRETPFVRAPDGRVSQIIGTFVDLTELRRAEAAARDGEERYRALFDSMTEGSRSSRSCRAPGTAHAPASSR